MIRYAGTSILFLGSLCFVGCHRDDFRFQIVFPEASALTKGAKVRFLGLEVGKVEKVEVMNLPDGSTPRVFVAVAIKDKSLHIRRDDKFGIATMGVLGEAYVNIHPGPSAAPAIASGPTVQGEYFTPSPKTFSSLVAAIAIGAKLESLPAEKQKELTKTFNAMLDAALEDDRRLRADPHESVKPKKGWSWLGSAVV